MTTLTKQDEKRIEVTQRMYRGELTVGQGALLLGISERQCYRNKRRGSKGAKGVIHGTEVHPEAQGPEKAARQMLKLAQGKYQGFNDHHLTEKLKEQQKIELSRERVGRILLPRDATPRKRRASKHRSRPTIQ
jgi:transposase